jgi:hypothetical protein
MNKCLLLAGILLMSSLYMSEPAHAADYKTRTVNSFETGVNESTMYGSWASDAYVVGAGNSATVNTTATTQYHGTYSAMLHIATDGDPDEGAFAMLAFTSNSSLGTFLFDNLRICLKFSKTSGSTPVGWFEFEQWNATALLSNITVELSLSSWTDMTITPTWEPGTTYFVLEFYLSEDELEATDSVMYLDWFRAESAKTSVRIRYWNLYTGLGYYPEKLLARYYSIVTGWTDVWQNEFQAYKGDEVGVQITDIFGRNVWTGTIVVDEDPEYLDILVPIVTVYIPKPDWYNDSVPMEWRITCLPYGPDGLAGIEIPATGFEFEILAGWYSISWLANHYVQAGNQTVYIDGNITQRRSFALTNISIPIDPDYEIEVNGRTVNLKSLTGFFNSLWTIGAALWDDYRIKALSLLLTFVAILGIMIRARELKKIAQRRST